MRSLGWLRHLAEREGNTEEARRMQDTITTLTQNPDRPDQPVLLFFNPTMPRFEPDTVLNVDGTKVFDHSKFAVTIQNTSSRAVEIESVMMTSVGNAAPSGLGDIKGYWRYPQGNHRLGPASTGTSTNSGAS